MSASKLVLIALAIAYVEARFGQEGLVQADIAALDAFGEPGAAATLAGQTAGVLLGGAGPCDKLTLADDIVTQLGDDPEVIAGASSLVAAEKNFNNFEADTGTLCGDPELPATEALRGILPLFDPDVEGADVQNDNAATSLGTPFDATGLSEAEVAIEQGFTNFIAQDAAGAEVALAGLDAGGAAAGDAAADDAAADDATADAAGEEATADATKTAAETAGDAEATQTADAGATETADVAAATETAEAGQNEDNQDQDNQGQNEEAADAAAETGADAEATETDAAGQDEANETATDTAADAQATETDAAGQDEQDQADANAAADDAQDEDAAGDAAAGGAAAGGAADFGDCDPTIVFEGGLGGRPADEFTFQSADATIAADQQEALNPDIIVNRVCDELGNTCGANDAAIQACLDAQQDLVDQGLGVDSEGEDVLTAFNDAVLAA